MRELFGRERDRFRLLIGVWNETESKDRHEFSMVKLDWDKYG